MIIMNAFNVPNPLNKSDIDHKDRDPANNKLTNLVGQLKLRTVITKKCQIKEKVRLSGVHLSEV